MGQLVEICLTWRQLAGERETSRLTCVKTTTTFENEKYLLEPNDCHFLYSNLVEELPKEVP